MTDILAIGAHPDDVELSAAGTLLHHIKLGKNVAIADLTAGELGTRGSAELRAKEAAASAAILGISKRYSINLSDGFFDDDENSVMEIIRLIRTARPRIVLANAISDRHPDHARAANLVSRACFLAGLIKIESFFDGKPQEAFRPSVVYHYIQERYVKPDFVIDITPYFSKKMESILAFESQFFRDGDEGEPGTPISGRDYLDFLEGRAREMGRNIGVTYAEGFTLERIPGIRDLDHLL